jgi:hypothetical protein
MRATIAALISIWMNRLSNDSGYGRRSGVREDIGLASETALHHFIPMWLAPGSRDPANILSPFKRLGSGTLELA